MTNWLGKKVVDKVSGFEGTVLEHNQRLYSVEQVFVVPHGLKDSTPINGIWFEVSRVSARQAGFGVAT